MQWAWVLLSFYITYTCLEWLVLCWKIFPAHIYVALLCFGYVFRTFEAPSNYVLICLQLGYRGYVHWGG